MCNHDLLLHQGGPGRFMQHEFIAVVVYMSDLHQQTVMGYITGALLTGGCPVVREKSGKFQTWQKSGKGQGILLKVREKMNIEKSQGICI